MSQLNKRKVVIIKTFSPGEEFSVPGKGIATLTSAKSRGEGIILVIARIQEKDYILTISSENKNGSYRLKKIQSLKN